jgi:glycerophosphoryl diester phosphodiesterase
MRPLVIAHRGASACLPEHTLPAYALAALQGADYLEPDLVMTADGALVARHDNRLELTTDVARRGEFAARRVQRAVDGVPTCGWFSEDFTLAEIRTLRAVERLPDLRPANARHDGLYGVPTLAEIVALARALEGVTGRRIGLYPEAKHPGHFAARGLDIAAALLAELHGAGYRTRADPVFVQCFEPATLRRARGLTDLKLVQLLDAAGAPADGEPDYATLASAAGLREIARYADAVGPAKSLVLGTWPHNAPAPAGTSFVADAHAAGLAVHAWTLRPENAFLPAPLRCGADPAAYGNHAAELRALIVLGVDGVFADAPGLVHAALEGGA